MAGVVTGLFHVAVKTGDLPATLGFYTAVLGLQAVPRPDFGYSGAWIGVPLPGGQGIIHVYAGSPALGPSGTAPSGTAAIDHISLTATRVSRLHPALGRARGALPQVHRAWHHPVAVVCLRSQWRAVRADVRRPGGGGAAARHVAGPALRRRGVVLRQRDIGISPRLDLHAGRARASPGASLMTDEVVVHRVPMRPPATPPALAG